MPFQKKPPRRAATGADNQLIAAKRLIAAAKARDSLLAYTRFTMPHPSDIDNPDTSRYEEANHHKLIAEHCEALERGDILRLIITMPPRHGKSELAVKRFLAWFEGRDPYRQTILATYNQTFAEDYGRDVRSIMQLPEHGLTFPGCVLRRDSQAADRLQTTEGGLMAFVGADGSVTGRGADLFVIDDPLKGRTEAESPTIRKTVWDFFTSAAYTRLMPGGRILIILTRWHEDDIVGRIFNSDFVDEREAKNWTVLSLPAIAGADDPAGRKPGEALWPKRYPVATLESIRRTIGPRDWSALYQQSPTPDDGTYFLRSYFKPYREGELPRNLSMYGASDHAVGLKQHNDATVLGCVGVDEDGDIWIMPDIVWGRLPPDAAVEAMLDQFQRHKPIFWWAEKGHISQSIGPFLREKMRETQIYQAIEEKTPAVDKGRRSQAIRGRAAVRQIRVPAYMPWWPDALDQLLKFPAAQHDDFVDWLSWIGIGLDGVSHARPARIEQSLTNPYKVGSAPWVVTQGKIEAKILNFSRKRAVGM